MYFFSDDKKVEKLGIVIESWLGTPYLHKAGVKGAGVDCVYFIGELLTEVGVVAKRGKIKYLNYNKQTYMSTKEPLIKNIEAQFYVEKLPIEEPSMDGDILLFKFGNSSSHMGICYNNKLVHAVNKYGVKINSLEDTIWCQKRRTVTYRLLCNGGI